MGSRLEAKSKEIANRISKHTFDNEDGEEYKPSAFGGFTDYFRRKKIKLQNLDAQIRQESLGQPAIFRGVVAHVNGYTQPSLNDLHHIIVSHGGGFIQYLDGKTMVTHIIASNLTPKKRVEFARYRIVKPAWIVESVQAGKLLPWASYRLLDEGPGQQVLGIQNGSVVNQGSKAQHSYKEESAHSWYNKQPENQSPISSSHLPGRFVIKDESALPQESQDRAPSSDFGSFDESLPVIQSNLIPPILPSSTVSPITKVTGHVLDTGIRLSQIPATDSALTNFTITPAPRDILNSSQHLDKSKVHTQRALDGHIDKAGMPQGLILESDILEQPLVAASSTTSPKQITSTPHPQTRAIPASPLEWGAAQSKSEKAAPLTSEEHNALLLADPRVRKSTVVNPEFLKQYYEESRLHHLSAWKAALKSQLQVLTAEKSASQRISPRTPRRYILHVDFDSFFAAVSLRDRPELTSKPVVIAHGSGTGAEIASCNYPARKFGVKNGMWMLHAHKLCSSLVVLPYDFKAYEDASRKFYAAILDTQGVVQSVSVDEALLDISAQCFGAGLLHASAGKEAVVNQEQKKADDIALALRFTIKATTQCDVSVGIGGNILLAKVALRKAKPAGQYQIKPEEILDFIGELSMQEIPGIAGSFGGKLENAGIHKVKDIRKQTKERMITLLGPKTGERVWNYSKGIDDTEVGDQVTRKSVSAEVNWGIRFVTQEQVDEFIYALAGELETRLLNENVKGRQLTMKVMRRAADAPLDPPKHLGHGKCDTVNKSLILGVATNDGKLIGREALSILKGFGITPGDLRGLGIQMQKLQPIKLRAEGTFQSSQKRIHFDPATPKKAEDVPKDEITDPDYIVTPEKQIADASTEVTHAAKQFGARSSLSSNRNPQTLLNTSGTQFILPSQADPDVLKELPEDIRKRLLATPTRTRHIPSAVVSPFKRYAQQDPRSPIHDFPSRSQLDPDALDAIPEDMRAEILSHYAQANTKKRVGQDQAVLPQSPRTNRTIRVPNKITASTTISKHRTRLFPQTTTTTLTQANFINRAKEPPEPPISTQVLNELPEDIRLEVLEEARRQKTRLDLKSRSTGARRPAKIGSTSLPSGPIVQGQRTLNLPLRQQTKPTFTSRKLWRVEDLQGAVSAWVEEFGAEGPYEEDVFALRTYLRRVVLEERDMDKAVAVARWLGFEVRRFGGQEWTKSQESVDEAVRQAVWDRGLGEVEF